MGGLPRPFRYPSPCPCGGPATPACMHTGLGSSAFARHYLRNHGCFLFLGVLRCFTSPGVARKAYEFSLPYPVMTRDGFPHSEISGSTRVCRSPKLIAAYHVLHRLLMPRHPWCALSILTKILSARIPRTRFYFALLLIDCQRTSRLTAAKSTPRPMPLVGVPGIEPGTSSLSGTRSNHLSYTPSRPDWWRQPGSNRRPRACKARALPTELCPLPADSSCRDPLGPPRTPRVNETSCSKPALEAKAERLGGPRLRHSRTFSRSSLTTRTVNPRRRPSRQPAP